MMNMNLGKVTGFITMEQLIDELKAGGYWDTVRKALLDGLKQRFGAGGNLDIERVADNEMRDAKCFKGIFYYFPFSSDQMEHFECYIIGQNEVDTKKGESWYGKLAISLNKGNPRHIDLRLRTSTKTFLMMEWVHVMKLDVVAEVMKVTNPDVNFILCPYHQANRVRVQFG